MNKERPKVIVIGAGVGGLAAASILARTADVTVLERSHQPGGKIHQAIVDNQPIDSGPTVFTLRAVFEEIFSASGARLDDYLTLRPVTCLSRNYWTTGDALDLYSSAEETACAIAKFSSHREADRYRRFVKDAERAWETLYQPFMRNTSPNFLSMIAKAGPFALTRLNPYTSLWKSLEKCFEDPRLQQMFGRYATYCGSSPFEASATLMLIAHVERMGVFAPVGGMAAVAKALEKRAIENGADFQYDSDVAEIEYAAGRPCGIVTQTGKRYEASIILFNGDISALTETAQPREHSEGQSPHTRTTEKQQRLKSVAAFKPLKKRSQSALTWSFLGRASSCVDNKQGLSPQNLSLHSVFFSDNYKSEFEDVYERKKCPTDPTVYLYAPDRAPNEAYHRTPSSSNNTPLGQHASSQNNHDTERFFCLINAPAIGDEHIFTPEEVEECRMRTMAQLKRCGIAIEMTPQKTQVQTPTDFAKRFPATNGALFGSPNHGWRAPFQRQGVRSKQKGLYFAGGSVHPGSGAPMAALSGLMAAQTITKDFALT